MWHVGAILHTACGSVFSVSRSLLFSLSLAFSLSGALPLSLSAFLCRNEAPGANYSMREKGEPEGWCGHTPDY